MSLLQRSPIANTNDPRACSCNNHTSASPAVIGLTIEQDPGIQQHTPEQLATIERMHTSIAHLHDCDATHITQLKETHVHPNVNARSQQNKFTAITGTALKEAGAVLKIAHTLDHTDADVPLNIACITPGDMDKLHANKRLTVPCGLSGEEFNIRLCDNSGKLVGVRWNSGI